MSITSTRRVSASTSYSSSVPRSYEAAQGGQSFVETIDTSNNVLIKDEQQSGHKQYFSHSETSEDGTFDVNEVVSEPVSQGLSSSVQKSPLLDNDENIEDVTYQNKNVGIYGTNQQISSSEEERVNNPYFKHFYENNEVIEDIDEFV